MFQDISGKIILILGGSSESIETVKNANEMGLKTIVVDPVPNAPAKRYAWKFYDTDALDLEVLVSICLSEKVDGVFVGLSERLLETYCKLCARIDTPCYCTLEQLAVFTDKIAFKEKCCEYGIPVVNDYSINDNLPYPVLVKPVDSSGSKGISVCNDREELLVAIERAKSYSHTERYLIEDYLRRDQLTANYNVLDGVPYLSLINDRYVITPDEGFGSVAIVVSFPSKYADLYMDTIHERMCRMLQDLDFKNAPLNLQAFVDKGVIRFYDPALRIGGGRAYIITESLTGFNVQKALLRFAVTGEMLSKDERGLISENDWLIQGKVALQLSLIVRTGTIGKIEGMDKLEGIPGLLSFLQLREEGEVISLAGTLQQVAIRFYLLTDTVEELINSYQMILDTIKIIDNKGEDMLLPPFDFHSVAFEYDSR